MLGLQNSHPDYFSFQASFYPRKSVGVFLSKTVTCISGLFDIISMISDYVIVNIMIYYSNRVVS